MNKKQCIVLLRALPFSFDNKILIKFKYRMTYTRPQAYIRVKIIRLIQLKIMFYMISLSYIIIIYIRQQ